MRYVTVPPGHPWGVSLKHAVLDMTAAHERNPNIWRIIATCDTAPDAELVARGLNFRDSVAGKLGAERG